MLQTFSVILYWDPEYPGKEVLVVTDYDEGDRGIFLRRSGKEESEYREWVSPDLPQDVIESIARRLLKDGAQGKEAPHRA